MKYDEGKLWTAVVAQGIKDATGKSHMLRKEALEWIYGSRSFEDTCDLANLEFKHIKNMLGKFGINKGYFMDFSSKKVTEIKSLLINNIKECLFYLIPGGKLYPRGVYIGSINKDKIIYLLPRGTFRGDKFYVGDVQGNKGKSTVVELTGSKSGLWHDFATGKGGDIFDLWAAVTGKNQFTETIEDIAKWIGYSKKNETLGQPTVSWNYYSKTDEVIATVYRYDTDSGKRYIPFDVKRSSFTAPEIRPLYNIPGILKSDTVILVEGEKCAESLIEQGITATTTMSGAHADANKTDWSQLKGKHVIIWPDNDEPGMVYAERSGKKLLEIGVESLSILKIPQDKPKGWDAADYVKEEINEEASIEEFILNTKSPYSPKKSKRIDTTAWTNVAPEREWIIKDWYLLEVLQLFMVMVVLENLCLRNNS